jgi:glycosyltransferase involved in cell wall biosynthesis
VNYATSGEVAAKLTGLPLILDDCSPPAEEEAFGVGVPGLARAIFRRQAAAASLAVVPSQALRSRLVADGVPREKLVVVPNGIVPGMFDPASREDVRARLGVVGDRCVIGFVGSYQPWHRMDLLIEAARELALAHPLHLLLVGDGPGLRPALAAAEQAGLSDRITSTGAIPSSDVAALLGAMDIGVLPGTSDYMHPMKLLDYAAAGLPSVAPDLAPVREVLGHERHGLLFVPGDPASLKSALARLASDAVLRRRLGRCARAQIAAGASWEDRGRALSAYIDAAVFDHRAKGLAP